MADGAAIILRRHGNPDGRRLVLSHGNGLAIDLYYPFWSLLQDDFDLMLYDLRNHGWNAVGDMSAHNVPTMVLDHDRMLEAIDDLYGAKPKIGVFHSASALASLLAAAHGDALAARVLFDPPFCRPGVGEYEFEAAAARTAAAVRRRTDRFKSREEFAEVLPFFPVFSRAVPGVHELVARTTLRPCADGNGYELRCPREFEAQIIDFSDVYVTARRLPGAAQPDQGNRGGSDVAVLLPAHVRLHRHREGGLRLHPGGDAPAAVGATAEMRRGAAGIRELGSRRVTPRPAHEAATRTVITSVSWYCRWVTEDA